MKDGDRDVSMDEKQTKSKGYNERQDYPMERGDITGIDSCVR